MVTIGESVALITDLLALGFYGKKRCCNAEQILA
jgi:hypothetical protein